MGVHRGVAASPGCDGGGVGREGERGQDLAVLGGVTQW